jgi:prefoldin subunit 5
MDICDNGHDPIAFNTIECPMCKQFDELNVTIEELETNIETLQDELSECTFAYRKLETVVTAQAPELLL